MKNNGQFKDGEWFISLIPESHPEEVMIELTTKCNYDCIYCFRRNLINEEDGLIDTGLALKIIDEAAITGVKKISFSGWGEPLLHPDALDILRYAKKKGLEVLLNTNGYFLKESIEEIFNIRVDYIIVSIDSPDDDVYKIIRKGGDLARLMEAFLRLLELRIEHTSKKPIVEIQFTINKYNYGNIYPMIRLAQRIGASRIVVSNIIPLSKKHEEQLACYLDGKCVSEVDKIKIKLAEISLETGVEISLPNFNRSCSERTCPYVSRRAIYVRHDGLVAPCIYYAHHWRNCLFGIEREIYPVIFGDLKKDKLIDIWRKPEYVRFRFRTYYMHYPSCLDCPVQEYCTLTLDNNSDCWGSNPSCAHCPYSRNLTRCPL